MCAGWGSGGCVGTMSRSNWNLVLRAADFGAYRETEYSKSDFKLPKREPVPWVCANRLCRAKFMRKQQASEYCPTCRGHLDEGRPDLLDPVVYAGCQKIIAEENKAYKNSEEYQAWVRMFWNRRHESKEQFNPQAAWRALLGLPPLKSDYDLDHEKDFQDLPKCRRPEVEEGD